MSASLALYVTTGRFCSFCLAVQKLQSSTANSSRAFFLFAPLQAHSFNAIYKQLIPFLKQDHNTTQ
jgi:hypothetical protein